MEFAKQIIYRKLTPADFYNIYKKPGAETSGGGQAYIDIPTKAVSVEEWHAFFDTITPTNMKGGPLWKFEINSLGLSKSQTISIGQRRPASVSIRSQKIHSNSSNRVLSWHPSHTLFPSPSGDMADAHDANIPALVENLVIYIIKTQNNKYWAGWLDEKAPTTAGSGSNILFNIYCNIGRSDGIIELEKAVPFDTSKINWPFTLATKTPKAVPKKATAKPAAKKKQTSPAANHNTKTEQELIDILFEEDAGQSAQTPTKKTQTTTVVNRNKKAVGPLKELYKKCQVSGTEFEFLKKDGTPYLEAHHLKPLGEGGADSPRNLVILSPLIHKMFHYADVTGLNINNISGNTLDFEINGKPYTITWHPEHLKMVNKYSKD